MKVRGIVVKIKDSHGLVLASDGTYHKVPLSRHKGARVGSEIEFSRNNWFNYVKPALLVASILVFALGLGLFRQASISPAFAYVSLDINPSVELEVGQDLNVISAHPLNNDAKKLLSHVKIDGRSLYASVNMILTEAVHEGYLKPGQKNYVLSTVTLENEPSKNIDYETLTDNISSVVQDKDVEVELLVLSTDIKLHKEAKRKGLSTGKLAVYRQAAAAGEKVTIQQVKDNSITKLVNDYKVNIIPADRKLIIKSLEIKPKKNGKDSHQVVKTIPGRKNSGLENNDSDNDLDMDEPRQNKSEKGKPYSGDSSDSSDSGDSGDEGKSGVNSNNEKGHSKSDDYNKKDNPKNKRQVSPPASSGHVEAGNNDKASGQEKNARKNNENSGRNDDENIADHVKSNRRD